MSVRVWKHPTKDTLRIQYDEDQIIEVNSLFDFLIEVTYVPGDWVELIPHGCDCEGEA